MIKKCCITAILTGATATLALSDTVLAQKPTGLPGNYPAKPVRVIVPAAAGGGGDFTARAVFGKLAESWGTTFLVENVAGAGGLIAQETTAKAAPDGYTLLQAGGSPFLVAAFGGKADYDVRNAYTAIAQWTVTPYLVAANSNEPFTDLKGMITYAKANPGKLSYGATGAGGGLHITAELIQSVAGIRMLYVPYKGTGQSVIDLIAGRINLAVGSTGALVSHVRAGKVRNLGITSATRMPSIPDLPTLAESGLPGFEYVGWFGVVGPAGMNPAVVNALNADMNRLLNSPDLRNIMNKAGNDVRTGTPEQFRTEILSLLDKTEKVIKDTGLKIE